MNKLILAGALVLAAVLALAGEPVSVPLPETIYNPNVAVPSYDDV
jgi:hypothetical protein